MKLNQTKKLTLSVVLMSLISMTTTVVQAHNADNQGNKSNSGENSAAVAALKQKIEKRGRVLLKHVEAVYPQAAQAQKLVGSVTMKFTVNKNGSIGNIEVVDSFPGRIFDNAAIAALAQWKYQPVNQPITDLLTRFDFKPAE